MPSPPLPKNPAQILGHVVGPGPYHAFELRELGLDATVFFYVPADLSRGLPPGSTRAVSRDLSAVPVARRKPLGVSWKEFADLCVFFQAIQADPLVVCEPAEYTDAEHYGMRDASSESRRTERRLRGQTVALLQRLQNADVIDARREAFDRFRLDAEVALEGALDLLLESVDQAWTKRERAWARLTRVRLTSTPLSRLAPPRNRKQPDKRLLMTRVASSILPNADQWTIGELAELLVCVDGFVHEGHVESTRKDEWRKSVEHFRRKHEA